MSDPTSDPQARIEFANLLKRQIDIFAMDTMTDGFRDHLGASIIGHDCAAYCWNTFRWLKRENFNGRMLRLFNRGHLEEPRFIHYLKGIGFTVTEKDSNGKQFQFAMHNGHYGGSLDAIAYRYDVGLVLGEFKTHNEKSFNELQSSGVQKSKPQHYRQICSYGPYFNLENSLYLAVNKNTDELHIEFLPIDYTLHKQLERKAELVIYSQTQPQKISQSPAFFTCKYCVFKGICHHGEEPERNCRSCINAKPSTESRWFCTWHKDFIPKSFIPEGCENWHRII